MSDIEDTMNPPSGLLEYEKKLKMFCFDLIRKSNEISYKEIDPFGTKHLDKLFGQLRKKYKCIPSKVELRYIYEKYYAKIKLNDNIKNYLIKRKMRSQSGVLVCTVVLKPSVFSCPMNCSYCPTETDLQGNPTQPKSYLSTEPAMLRALQYNFDIREQIHDRIRSYIKTGNIDLETDNQAKKLEIIVSGGTFESYPYEYRDQVMNEIYWACNSFENNNAEKKSIEDEIKINETSQYRVIGLTIETRPDFITKTSIKHYRSWGVTRVQIGVQHYDDNILKKINRECYTVDTIRAIKLLKQTGFKVVCHLMPDLPNSSPELDKWMFFQAINNQNLQFDDVKIYPTAVCQSENSNIIVKSDIADWYRAGKYIPYAETNLEDLIRVLIYYKTNIQPWVRIQRLVRDIPRNSITVGYERISNLRQVLQNRMEKEGLKCNCIRCMEIKNTTGPSVTRLVVRKFKASEGLEYFISFETHKQLSFFNIWKYMCIIGSFFCILFYLFRGKTWYWGGNLDTYTGLIGFCRLRLDKNAGAGFISELENSAIIREVHVYGNTMGIHEKENDRSVQHKGYGKMLVKTAEIISKENGYDKIAVIAGVGTREYYKNKCGYELEGTYMIKKL
jgi:ELP3 family radical SAM enzyme/protein acetyltransferase